MAHLPLVPFKLNRSKSDMHTFLSKYLHIQYVIMSHRSYQNLYPITGGSYTFFFFKRAMMRYMKRLCFFIIFFCLIKIRHARVSGVSLKLKQRNLLSSHNSDPANNENLTFSLDNIWCSISLGGVPVRLLNCLYQK